jgi:hypothetical protein
MVIPLGLGRGRPPAERAGLRVVGGYIRPHWRALLAGGLLSLATAATGLLLLPLVVRALIDGLSHHRGLTGAIVLLCLLMLADAALGSAGNYVLLRTGETITLAARQRLVAGPPLLQSHRPRQSPGRRQPKYRAGALPLSVMIPLCTSEGLQRDLYAHWPTPRCGAPETQGPG